MNIGIAVGVEATNEATGEISYRWSTAWVSPTTKRVGNPTGAEFLKSKVNFDMGSLINSSGDSIYMVLSRHQRIDRGQTVDGYVFIHNCPIGISKGSVIPFESTQRW